ncbi:histidinol-phosphatase [Jatrophihabitans telluris]|uniref:Histidinol-phosphatase n=1 Tax=Jatrophihabitans telluris TaxID=2038343 RepID=A0ABY4R3N9_9ACTN|nr:histidinol-phosphatase [Jatrophihabitans telluris]UQX89796.1 histidinol-phosphatase [Jatrophihabitans telluris]
MSADTGLTPTADDLAIALELADLADGITTSRYRAADLVVTSKPDLSPVSDADQAVERAIGDRLAEARPDDAFFGEEFGAQGHSRRTWVVDPIDGTKNYVRGVPVWATLIALLIDDEPVLGVVSAPALGQRWWARRGQGAYAHSAGQQPRRIRVSEVGDLVDASLSYASIDGWQAHDRVEEMIALTRRVWRSRAYGDFWSYMLVAEGAVDVAAEPELSLWDMAALAPIVTEAGGSFTGLDGVPGVQQGHAAASNGRLHAALLDAVGIPVRPQPASSSAS